MHCFFFVKFPVFSKKITLVLNPLESFNTIIKALFTNRSKLNIVNMLNTFKQVIQYESSKLCNYEFLKIKLVYEKYTKKAMWFMLSKLFKYFK